jgi:hypothetical protein
VWSAGFGKGSARQHLPSCYMLEGKMYRTFFVLHKICLCVVMVKPRVLAKGPASGAGTVDI